MRIILPLVALALATSACSKSNDEGTSISIDAGNGSAAVDGGTGEVTLDTPLIKGKIKLPKLQLTADDFDINGVHLYPGSTLGAMNVNATGKDDGIVSLTFDSPAPVATVRDWLRGEFEKAGTKVEVEGDSLRGMTEDKAFRIDLQPAGERATGKVTIG